MVTQSGRGKRGAGISLSSIGASGPTKKRGLTLPSSFVATVRGMLFSKTSAFMSGAIAQVALGVEARMRADPALHRRVAGSPTCRPHARQACSGGELDGDG